MRSAKSRVRRDEARLCTPFPPLILLILVLVLSWPMPGRANLIGADAPPLSISAWIKGGPVEIHDGKHIYVVEFWQTSCGPCRRSIPHLTDLQQMYRDDVIIIGISNEPADIVNDFVAARQDMDYTVAVDTDSQTFVRYHVLWIPQAFLVRPDGTIVWQGESVTIDEFLAQLVANPISISRQPVGRWVEAGRPYTFELAAAGLGPLHYAWSKDGKAIGSDVPIYSIETLDLTDSGTYICVVSDERGRKSSLTSASAVLDVFPEGSLPVTGHFGLLVLCVTVLAAGGVSMTEHRKPLA